MKYLTLITVLFLSVPGWSHPVSFKGGTSLMSYNSDLESDVMLTYSYDFWGSVGLRYLNFRDLTADYMAPGQSHQSEFTFAQGNFLLKRWNQEHSQTNIYLSGGAGIEKNSGKTTSAQVIETQADWESRQYYVLGNYQRVFREKADDLQVAKGRLGFAPFIGDYEDLNIWVIAEAVKMNDMDVQLNQILRFYHKNVLWEFGGNFKGSLIFNFMVHM